MLVDEPVPMLILHSRLVRRVIVLLLCGVGVVDLINLDRNVLFFVAPVLHDVDMDAVVVVVNDMHLPLPLLRLRIDVKLVDSPRKRLQVRLVDVLVDLIEDAVDNSNPV